MGNERSGVIGIGYEGKDASEIIDELAGWNVTLLVDVRLNPISRKKGLSKTALSAALSAKGIEYRHAPELGNPKDNRPGYAEVGTENGDAARENFGLLLARPAAQAAIGEIADRARREFVAVMCFEENERQCHRREVLHELRENIANEVVSR